MQKHTHISAELTPAQETAFLEAVTQMESQLPFLVDMGSDERRRLAIAGDKSQAFVQKALDIATDAPEILPRDFELEEFRKDVNLIGKLNRLSSQLTRLQERLRNTIIAAQADAYQQALEVYHRSKRTQRDGFGNLARDLGLRFRKAQSPRPQPTTAAV